MTEVDATAAGPFFVDPIGLARELIAIDSVNPDLVPGAAGEALIATYCAEWLGRHGFEVHRLESRPGRPSIVGVARGTGGGRSLMLNGHLDTVAHAGYDGDPLAGLVRDGRLFGRGAFDMKSGLAAIMVAAARAIRARPSGDVLVACVADEEFGSLGTEDVLRHFRADAAVIAEPSGLQLTLAHRGFAWFEVVLRGRAAHGSMPKLGVDAIEHAGYVLRELDRIRRGIEARPAHPLLGHGAVRVALIHGGTDAATVASECRLTIERRMLPGESPAAAELELRQMLAEIAAAVPEFAPTLERRVARAAFEAHPSSPIAATVADQAQRILGARPPVRGEPFWTDAGLFDEAGIPCVLIGVAGGGAHAATEWTEVSSVLQLTEILAGTIEVFCA